MIFLALGTFQSLFSSPPSRAVVPDDLYSKTNPNSNAAIALQRLGLSQMPQEGEVWVADLMVVYTPEAAAAMEASGGIEKEINASIHETNLAFQNSRVPVRVNLVHTELVQPEEKLDLRGSLERLVNKTDQWLDSVHTLRTLKKADLVSLVIASDSDTASGIAKLMSSPPNLGFASQAFSVIRWDKLTGQYTMAHELAHNMGCQHDRLHAFDVNGEFLEGAFPFSFGYQFSSPSGDYRTVMGAGNDGKRIPYFSNPLITFDSVAIGIDSESEDSADNSKSISQTANLVSAFQNPAVKTRHPTGALLVEGGTEFTTSVGEVLHFTSTVGDPDGRIVTAGLFFDLNRAAFIDEAGIQDGTLDFSVAYDRPGRFDVTVSLTDDKGGNFITDPVHVTVRPSGDDLVAPISLETDWALYAGTNVSATREDGEPVHSIQNPGANSVWLKWTPPGTGTVEILAKGQNFLPLAFVYQGNELNSLVRLAQPSGKSPEPNSSLTSGDVTAGQEYLIAIVGLNDGEGAFELSLIYLDRPSSDDFAQRVDLGSVQEQTFRSNNEGSTLEPGEPMHWQFEGGKSVWYAWTAPAKGSLNITVSTTRFDPLIGIYTGDSVSALTDLEPTRTQQHTETNGVRTLSRSAIAQVEEGRSYAVAVDGFGGQTGEFQFHLKFEKAPDPPANDLFADAQLMEGAFIRIDGTTTLAGPEPGEPDKHANNEGDTSVWYRWTAPLAGNFTALATGQGYLTLTDVYRGTSLETIQSARTRISFPDDLTTKLEFSAIDGEPYYFVVAGFFGDSGPFSFSMTPNNVPVIQFGLTPGGFSSSDNQLELQVAGLPGQPFTVETSTNLMDWSSWSNQSIPVNSTSSVVKIPATESAGFFRIRQN